MGSTVNKNREKRADRNDMFLNIAIALFIGGVVCFISLLFSEGGVCGG